MNFFATCKIGLESLVSNELKELGIEVTAVHDARVDFSGSYTDMATALIYLRTAERVLMQVGSFEALNFEQLYEGVRAIEWKNYINKNNFIHVTGKSAKSKLFSVSDCQRISKKAIVDSLSSAYGLKILPENGNRIIVEIGILRDQVTVALDCCGAGLSRRGYRTYNVPAPISETLGAAIVLLSGYKAERQFIDPMCGSGTMPIEAAMIATNTAVGLNRSFAAEEWHFIRENAFELARERARDCAMSVPFDITGSDIDAHSIELCKKHAKKAGVMLSWRVASVLDFKEERSGGVLCCNPPYGERLMEKRDAEKLYRNMHEVFSHLDGWSVNIIASHPEFERVYGQRADKRRKLSNGGMVSTLYRYYPRYSDRRDRAERAEFENGKKD
ncbi:MAG: class I SAM-dependent RNA methyltransferase [Clostridia bacterium]|nr:class I SAM-dependent RNA methyltransferase [Clostridia bacterium]